MTNTLPNLSQITQMLLPCFDDPIVRSTFSVKIKNSSNLTGLSNMPIETSQTNDNETEIQFIKTPPMCTYLLAIFIGEFASIEGETKNGLPVKMYAENGRQELMKKFLDAANFTIEWMEEKMAVKCELPHIQFLSHPGLKTGWKTTALLHYVTIHGAATFCMIYLSSCMKHLTFGLAIWLLSNGGTLFG